MIEAGIQGSRIYRRQHGCAGVERFESTDENPTRQPIDPRTRRGCKSRNRAESRTRRLRKNYRCPGRCGYGFCNDRTRRRNRNGRGAGHCLAGDRTRRVDRRRCYQTVHRRRQKANGQAEEGLAELRGCVDTIITIPNSKLKEVEEKISIMDAFRRADEVLLQAVQGISDLITIPGIINLDFADVRSVMQGMGVALMGIGSAEGEGAAVKAMKAAIDSKLLEENSIKGAKGALINITGSTNMPLSEIEEALSLINEEAHDDANIIFGTVFDAEMEDRIKITVIATGFDNHAQAEKPKPRFSNDVNAMGQAPARSISKTSDKEVEEKKKILKNRHLFAVRLIKF